MQCCNEHWGVCILLSPFFSPNIVAGVGLLDHMVALFSVFKGTSTLFSIVAIQIYIPTNSVGGFSFLHTLSNISNLQTLVCRFLDGHSDWYETISHCSFDLHFSNI